MKGFKVVTLRKNGTIGSLFINRRKVLPMGVWLDAEPHKTKGFAFRPLWHACHTMNAPHLSMKGRVWVSVDMEGVSTLSRCEAQGGEWVLAERIMINTIQHKET